MTNANAKLVLAVLFGGMACPGMSCASPQEAKAPAAVETPAAVEAPKAVKPPAVPAPPKAITIKRIEAIDDDGKERTWLGVGLDEPDEALSSQLGLKDGVGLLVTYVVADSPAGKAGLKKNDVLLEMEGQMLLVTAQLQKLVQARKEGDVVTLKLLRGGKEESVTASLGKTKTRVMTADGDNALVWRSAPGAYSYTLAPGAHADHMIILEKALKDAKIDQERVKVEVQRSMEEARKAMEEALRTTRKADGSLKEVHKELEALAKARVFMPNDAVVVVRSSEKSNKSMVQADESGTIVLVKNPKLRLTAHDKDGNLIFDGEVESKEQREKVPADLWKKVAPLIEKFSSGDDE